MDKIEQRLIFLKFKLLAREFADDMRVLAQKLFAQRFREVVLVTVFILREHVFLIWIHAQRDV